MPRCLPVNRRRKGNARLRNWRQGITTNRHGKFEEYFVRPVVRLEVRGGDKSRLRTGEAQLKPRAVAIVSSVDIWRRHCRIVNCDDGIRSADAQFFGQCHGRAVAERQRRLVDEEPEGLHIFNCRPREYDGDIGRSVFFLLCQFPFFIIPGELEIFDQQPRSVPHIFVHDQIFVNTRQ